MSFILESLKKSDRNREGISPVSAEVVETPAFLDHYQPPQSRLPLLLGIGIFIVILLLGLGLGYWFFLKPEQNTQAVEYTVTAPPVQALPAQAPPVQQAQALPAAPQVEIQREALIPSTISQPIANEPEPSAKPAAGASVKEQEVVSLYKKATEQPELLKGDTPEEIALKKRNFSNPAPERSSPDAFTEEEAAERFEQAVKKILSESAAQPQLVPEPEPEPELKPEPELTEAASADSADDVVNIPLVYKLDAATKRNIPPISYGAHIFSTNSRNGFVILNGAKKRVGDSLRSGIYIEQIASDRVILSYNGVVFALPALKDWSYDK